LGIIYFFKKDIVISKGFRFNYQIDNLVIQKLGQDDGGVGKIVIPYGTDLSNIGNGGSSYTPVIPEDLNTFYLNNQVQVLIILYLIIIEMLIIQLGALFKAKDNNKNLFVIYKKNNNLRIGTIYYDWSGKVDIGGEQLYLYGKNGIDIVTDDPNYENKCTLSCTKDGVKFANFGDTKSIFLPYGTDLTNIQNGSITPL
jgi:hypothetical protein